MKTFRVDNPHTKPLPFWEWMIREVQDRHPDTIFLSEAFTRPKMMRRLAKIGFTQSYSYFTWRNTKAELTEYLTELTQDEPKRAHAAELLRQHARTSTRSSCRPPAGAGFRIRAVLAATLSPLWGVYSGFELCEANADARPGGISRQREVRDQGMGLGPARQHPGRDHQAEHAPARQPCLVAVHRTCEFHAAWNDQVLVYSKMTASMDNVMFVAVNLDPRNAQSCNFEVPLWRFGLDGHGDDRGRGPARRPPLRLDRQGPAHLARPASQSLRDLAADPARAAILNGKPAIDFGGWPGPWR